ncbi:MAG: nicotinate-nucleotide--dimethylbenzimidazole phosphoribosyltransferase, partial [Burkholderiaceae bacterium]
MNNLIPQLVDISDTSLTLALQQAMDNKTKPVGSLGRLEQLGVQLGQILGTTKPE